MAVTPLKLAFFGDGGTDTVQGTTFYHDVGGYSSNFIEGEGEFASAGPSEAAVARFIHEQQPSDVIELGDLSYNYNASTLLDRNLGQYYNAFLYPYPSPFYSDPQGPMPVSCSTGNRPRWAPPSGPITFTTGLRVFPILGMAVAPVAPRIARLLVHLR